MEGTEPDSISQSYSHKENFMIWQKTWDFPKVLLNLLDLDYIQNTY